MKGKSALFKRRFYRIPFNNPVKFQILKYNRRHITHLSSKSGPGQGHDLGEDGLSFVSPYSLPYEMVIRVVFDLPESGEQRILAQVVRNSPLESGYFTAVQFLNLNGVRKERLKEYITGETRKNYKFLKYL